ncbi:MAG: cupin-like domain-containing protein [Xanthomonadaceae bacterium]|nr:cupin-like domain-containing protein [Xanthomonadaceae bacterium]
MNKKIHSLGFLSQLYEKSPHIRQEDCKIIHCTPIEFKREVKKETNLPIIIQSNLDSQLSLESSEVIRWLEQFNDKKIQVRIGNFSDPKEYAYNRKTYESQFSEYLLNLKKNNQIDKIGYLGNYKLSQDSLLPAWALPPDLYSQNLFMQPSLWLGPSGAITPLHTDGLDNFAVHIVGSKRWTLVPIQHYPDLEVSVPFPDLATDLHTSSIDLNKLGGLEWLKKNHITHTQFICGPDETLYLPAGWFHYVETLTPSLMVNWWVDKAKAKPRILTSVK